MSVSCCQRWSFARGIEDDRCLRQVFLEQYSSWKIFESRCGLKAAFRCRTSVACRPQSRDLVSIHQQQQQQQRQGQFGELVTRTSSHHETHEEQRMDAVSLDVFTYLRRSGRQVDNGFHKCA
jgi:hypothetical protein